MIDHEGYGNDQVSTGYFGSGDGKVKFTRTLTANEDWSVVEETFVEEGDVKSVPFYQYFYPEHTWDYPFQATNVWKADASQMKLEYSSVGHMNNADWNMQQSAEIKSMKMSQSSNKVTINVAGSTNLGANFPMEMLVVTIPNHDLDLSANVGGKCTVNPFKSGCKAELKVSGSINNAAIDEQSFKYTASSSKIQFVYKSGGQWQFKAQLLLGKYYTVKYMCRASNVMSYTLFLILPSPAALPDIQEAVFAYIEPFKQYFMALFDDVPHSILQGVTYSDVTLAWIEGKNLFDCSDIVTAVGFECPPLAESIGASLMQDFLKEQCVEFNSLVESTAVQGVAPVQEARAYVADLVGAPGKAQFDAWWAQVIA